MRPSLLVLALCLPGGCSSASPRDAPDVEHADASLDVPPPLVPDGSGHDGVPDVAGPDLGVDLGSPGGPWRSALYPPDWAAGLNDAEGRFLHDFSFAGYRLGSGLPVVEGTVFDVTDFGADPTAAADSHGAFQAAIDGASVAGGIVFVPAGLYRVDDVLRVTASNVVLRGEGADASRLWFTRFDQMSSQSQLAFDGSVTTASEHRLAEDGVLGRTSVLVEDASAIAVGDDVAVGWVISPQFVAEHGMSGTWIAFNDTWQPFFRREVVAVDVAARRVELDVPLRYTAKVRDAASLRVETGYLSEVGVEDIGVADAVGWEDAWSQTQVHVIELDGVEDAWIRDIASFASPGAPTSGPGAGMHLQNGGILVLGSKRVTVADSRLELAQNRGGGGCGYLFEVRQSSEILFRDLVGRAGRHNFIQNWGFGTSGMVWLRVHSSEGRTFANIDASLSATGDSEFHHSLAMANLIDSSTFDDGVSALNRKDDSTGAGHTATQTVFWNVNGAGRLRSFQFGHGYVIGTSGPLTVRNDLPGGPFTDEERAQLEDVGPWTAAWPADWVEGEGRGIDLEPRSLYMDQRQRR